jgi:hypothetical protein
MTRVIRARVFMIAVPTDRSASLCAVQVEVVSKPEPSFNNCLGVIPIAIIPVATHGNGVTQMMGENDQRDLDAQIVRLAFSLAERPHGIPPAPVKLDPVDFERFACEGRYSVEHDVVVGEHERARAVESGNGHFNRLENRRAVASRGSKPIGIQLCRSLPVVSIAHGVHTCFGNCMLPTPSVVAIGGTPVLVRLLGRRREFCHCILEHNRGCEVIASLSTDPDPCSFMDSSSTLSCVDGLSSALANSTSASRSSDVLCTVVCRRLAANLVLSACVHAERLTFNPDWVQRARSDPRQARNVVAFLRHRRTAPRHLCQTRKPSTAIADRTRDAVMHVATSPMAQEYAA